MATTKQSGAAGKKNRGCQPRQRRSSAEIRERLLQASREEFERCGYSGARTAAIAKRAEVTEAQLFRYFPSKADLFRSAVFEPLNKHFTEFVSKHLGNGAEFDDFRDVERLYIDEFQQFLDQNAGMLLSLVVADNHSSDTAVGLTDIDGLGEYFARGAKMMSTREAYSESEAAIMVRVSFAAMLGCVLMKDHLFAGTGLGEKKVDRAITEFILDGISERE